MDYFGLNICCDFWVLLALTGSTLAGNWRFTPPTFLVVSPSLSLAALLVTITAKVTTHQQVPGMLNSVFFTLDTTDRWGFWSCSDQGRREAKHPTERHDLNIFYHEEKLIWHLCIVKPQNLMTAFWKSPHAKTFFVFPLNKESFLPQLPPSLKTTPLSFKCLLGDPQQWVEWYVCVYLSVVGRVISSDWNAWVCVAEQAVAWRVTGLCKRSINHGYKVATCMPRGKTINYTCADAN